jgi:hypothetical protein
MIRACLSDLKIKPPVPRGKEWCIEVHEVPRPKPEWRFFSAKGYWFYMTHERDVDSAYLQVLLSEGLGRLYYGSRPINSVDEFKALAKSIMPYKYAVVKEDTGWPGMLYKSDRPRDGPKYCQDLTECARYEGHLFKRWTKYIPQILLGWLKKHYGHPAVDYVASTVNGRLRSICAPSPICMAHVHDGLVMRGGPGPKLPFKHKVESREGWTWAGLVAPGDPPRYWGFMPARIMDIVIIDRALREAPTPESAFNSIKHLCLWPEVFERSFGREAPGLVDLEYLVKALKPEDGWEALDVSEYIWDLL